MSPAKAAGRWEGMDDRLQFLLGRLVSVEASLNAVNDAIAKGQGGAAKVANAVDAEHSLQKWQQFYAQAARRLFRSAGNQKLGRAAVLLARQQHVNRANPDGNVGGDEIQPPNIEQLSKAYDEAKSAAEAALGAQTNLDELQKRRIALENEQSSLWCEIALRAIAGREVSKKTVYRFEPLPPHADTGAADQKQKMIAAKSAAQFMHVSFAIISSSERDPAAILPRVNAIVSEARERLDNRWLRLGALSDDTRDPEKLLGKFSALAKQLTDAAGNLTDSYRVATDPDTIGDPRRERFRALLEDAAIRYAEVLLALDEVLGEMVSQWQIKPDLDNSLSLPALADLPAPPVPAKPAAGGSKGWTVIGPEQLKTDFDLTSRGTPTDAGIEFTRASLGQEVSTATSHDEYKLPLEIEFTLVGFPDGCYDLWPQIGDIKFEWANDYNRTSYVHVKDVRYTATHVRAVPNQENIVRFVIDKNSRLVITVNDREVFNRKVEIDFPADGKIVLGGGIGHVLYKQVRVRTDSDAK